MTCSVPRLFDHVLIIMFENQYRSYVMQNRYFRRLAAQGIDMANYFGVMHPSQTNYIASTAGELCNVTDDDQPATLLPQRTIVDLVEESPFDLAWKAYMDSYIPQNQAWSPDLKPKDEYPYVIKHNPFSSFENIVRNEERWKRIDNEAGFWQDLLNGRLPNYAWFTPNMWNDGHYLAGTQEEPPQRAPKLVDQAAEWLEGFFDDLRFPGPDSHLPPRTLVVVTFDEADFEGAWDKDQKYTYDGPNQIYTALLGDVVCPGVEHEGYNHYSLIRTIEKNFGLATLEKNDARANWFKFLWGRRFAWSAPQPTPVATTGDVTACEFDGALYVAYAGPEGYIFYRTFDGANWSDEHEVGQRTTGRLRLAAWEGSLTLVFQVAGGTLHATRYDAEHGWSGESQEIVAQPVDHFDLSAADNGQRLMLAYQDENGDLHSLTLKCGADPGESVPVGFRTDGDLAVAALGTSLFLIHKQEQGHQMLAVSYNTAPFNVVKLQETKFSGSYDDTTIDEWSPSQYPVAHFSRAAYPGTPKELEPETEPYQAGAPYAAATLEGVLHLAHPGVSNDLVLTECFSIHGLMTPKLPASYDPQEAKTTNSAYGTLAQAGWSEQHPIHGVYNRGSMTMARLGEKLILLHQPEKGGPVRLCQGGYVT